MLQVVCLKDSVQVTAIKWKAILEAHWSAVRRVSRVPEVSWWVLLLKVDWSIRSLNVHNRLLKLPVDYLWRIYNNVIGLSGHVVTSVKYSDHLVFLIYFKYLLGRNLFPIFIGSQNHVVLCCKRECILLLLKEQQCFSSLLVYSSC